MRIMKKKLVLCVKEDIKEYSFQTQVNDLNSYKLKLIETIVLCIQCPFHFFLSFRDCLEISFLILMEFKGIK